MKSTHYFLTILVGITYNISANNNAIFDEFIEQYTLYGTEQYMIDEPITQADHVKQAAYIAYQSGAPENIIIGNLMHDIGQLVDADHIGDAHALHGPHAQIGQEWLMQRGLPKNVYEWVGNHALAKIVLCQDDPDYYNHLSRASQDSYHIQKKIYLNNPDGVDYITHFRTHPNARNFCAQRKCDDMAKIINLITPDFEWYRNMFERVHTKKGKPATNQYWRETINALHAFMCADRSAFDQYMRHATEQQILIDFCPPQLP